MSKNWHQFIETTEGDEQCAGCRVVVAIEAQMTFALPCPAGPCNGDKNPDDACVFVPKRTGPSFCVYCGRAGDLKKDLGDRELARAEFAAGLIPLSEYADQ